MIIMQTKNHNGSSHIGLPEVISAKSPGFLEILLESTWYHFLCAPSTPPPLYVRGREGEGALLAPLQCYLCFIRMYVYD